MNTHRASRLLLVTAAAATLVVAAILVAGGASDLPSPADFAAPTATGEATLVRAPVAADGHRDEAPRAPYDLRPGDHLTIACEFASDASLRQGDGAAQELGIGIGGELSLRVLARDGDELALQATMPAATVRGGTPEIARVLRAELRDGSLVRLAGDGAILGYRFPAGMNAERRNLVRAMVAALRARVGEPGATTWRLPDADATGVAEFDGAADTGRREVRVHKLGYRGEAMAQIPVVDGEAVLQLAPTTGWWQQVHVTEHCRVELREAQLVVEARAEARAELLTAGRGDAPAAFDWNAPWAAAAGSGDRDGHGGDPLDAQVAAELRGASLSSEFARLQQLLATDADDAALHTARMHLIWLLRNDPLALRELDGLLAGTDLPQRLVAEVLSAVGAADTAATQQFLTGRLAAGSDQVLRVLAAQAMFQGTGPATPVVTALRAVFADGETVPELTGTGMLLLGALANRPDGETALQDLLARGPFARDRGLVVDWLEALGNSGAAAVVDAALPSFASPDVAERAAATSAVRNVDEPRANAALADRVEHDESPIVRARAVEVLANHTGPGLPPLFLRVFEQDRDPGVRCAALLAFARGGDPAAVTATLQHAAVGDPAPAVRQLAQDLLTGRGA